jgi:TetR/AcrR family transcriptional repressor of lmrAB and yxaGH operons
MDSAASSASPPKSSSSRDTFVRATARLLRRQGYAATGLNEIVADSGAPRGSLYFHFPGGKQELATIAMERAGAQLAASMNALLGASADLGEALAHLIDALASGLEGSGYADGCPIATVALEAACDCEPIREAAVVAFDSWLAALRARLLAAGMDREAAARRATLVLAAIEGALILARARRSVQPLIDVRDELLAALA